MQERSRATAEKFIAAALELLHERTFKELSVAELARTAGRSVGVFYQRFGSKDDFLDVLLSAYFQESLAWRSTHKATAGPEEIYSSFLRRGFEKLRENRNLWHAALEQAAADPQFWSGFGPFREQAVGYTRMAVEEALGRALTGEERRRMAIAGQVFNSVINNQIINGPGPLKIEDDDFFPELLKIVLAIAAIPSK